MVSLWSVTKQRNDVAILFFSVYVSKILSEKIKIENEDLLENEKFWLYNILNIHFQGKIIYFFSQIKKNIFYELYIGHNAV